MAPASLTAKPLLALRNSFTAKGEIHWAHQRGLDSESIVQKYYLKKGYKFLAQRLRTPFAEVDLLFRTSEGSVLMVEVKTANLSDFHQFRISQRQRVRLERALQFLAGQMNALVEIHWAFVTKTGELTIIEDICG